MFYFYDLSKSNKEHAWNSKFIITNILMPFCLFIWCFLVGFTHKTFLEAGWGINQINSSLSVGDEVIRLWMLLFTSIILVLAIYNIYATIRSGLNNWFLLSLGIFNWLFLYKFIKQSHHFRLFERFIHNHKFHESNIIQVSFYNLYSCIKGDIRFNKIAINTILYSATFLFFFIGFIFILIPDLDGNFKTINNTFSYNISVYFTNLTNIACFLFLIGFIFFQNKKLYFSNRLAINMCSYITVVALIYWCVLFPTSASSWVSGEASALSMVEGIWLHAFTPILFISFVLNSSGISLTLQKGNYWKRSGIVLLYPLWYMSYAYSIPFLVRESVYGAFTNLNPYGYIWDNNELVKNGNPLYVFAIIGFGLLFIFIMFIYIGLVNLINKNNYRFKNINTIN